MAVGSPSGAMRKLWNQTAGRRGGTGDVLDAPERRWKMGHFRGYEFHLKKKLEKIWDLRSKGTSWLITCNVVTA